MPAFAEDEEPEGTVYPEGFKFVALMAASYIAMFLVALVCRIIRMLTCMSVS